MADFEAENGEDGEKAMDNLRAVQCPFNKEDLDFWFSEFEGQLEVIEVKSQWTKKTALQRFLPNEIKMEVKGLLQLKKSAAGDDIYLRLKNELLELFGSKPEDDYIRAKNRVLTGKPSQLGKKLIDDICKKEKKLDGCCCDKTVWAMFREDLPVVIRNHIAEMKFDKTTYKDIFRKADQVYASNSSSEPAAVSRPAVAAVKADQSPQDGAVAAVNRTRPQRQQQQQQQQKPARGQGGGRGGRGGKSNTPQNTPATSSKPKGTKHPTATGKEDQLCKIHFQWGVNALYCAKPWQCPMKDVLSLPQ